MIIIKLLRRSLKFVLILWNNMPPTKHIYNTRTNPPSIVKHNIKQGRIQDHNNQTQNKDKYRGVGSSQKPRTTVGQNHHSQLYSETKHCLKAAYGDEGVVPRLKVAERLYHWAQVTMTLSVACEVAFLRKRLASLLGQFVRCFVNSTLSCFDDPLCCDKKLIL
jgi:hypothetical protein